MAKQLVPRDKHNPKLKAIAGTDIVIKSNALQNDILKIILHQKGKEEKNKNQKINSGVCLTCVHR